ncbi:MAG TPA: efflux RND transporter permease subunit [Devosia sp.]|nr:efflux RND transporter permease subunit [Devosia sp.]
MTDTAPRPSRRRSLASFFIARPIFAIVLAIVAVLAGVIGIVSLSITQYPEIAPTTVRVSASDPGASADAVENSVTTIIENAMTGLEGLLYMESSSSTGSASVTLTFSNAVSGDTAEVQVQNKLSSVERRLPTSVQNAGLSVNRSTSSILMIGNIVSNDDKYATDQLSDIMTNDIQPVVERIDGVGGIQAFGSGYAMRIWLDPLSLDKYQLTPSDVVTAIQQQNVQVSVGSIGASPVVAGQQLRAVVTAQSQLTTVDQFKAIILKSDPTGSTVRLDDVARVEIGLSSYGSSSTFNGHSAAGFGVQLASGANAITVANAVHATLDGLKNTLPQGVSIAYSYETTPFVEQSIEKVVETLVEAIVLVFVVLLLFLQNLRATLIPMIAIPVVLLGTFGILAALGFTINMLTMFAMVLAIGLLVDDAIVVVENVSRIMTDEGLSPREATEKSMQQITGALIGIALVLTAVFIPMAFFGGSVGVIYRQFSVTIVSAMGLSVLVAIILTPALCAMLLRPPKPGRRNWLGWFDRGVRRGTSAYVGAAAILIVRPLRVLAVFVVLGGAAYFIYATLPSSFVPQEDQGVLTTQISLPVGANAARTEAVVKVVEGYFLNQEKANVDSVFTTVGFGYGGGGENNAMAFVRLKDFSQRPSRQQSAAAIAARASAYFQRIRDAQVYALAPPAIQGLGQTSGFSMYLEDTGNQGRDALNDASNKLAQLASQSSKVTNVRGNAGNTQSQLQVNIDQEKAGALGVSLSDANAVLATAFGGTDVNDFDYNGQIRPVYVQGDAPYRMQPDDVERWYARNGSGEMVPFSAFTTTQWTQGAPSLARFNGAPAIAIQGDAADGVSSGDAMTEMETLVAQLSGGYSAAWSGLSYEERLSGSQATLLYAISVLVVFLSLAALYESWSIPFAVILSVPVGVFGALLAAKLLGQSDDVYFKVGLLTTIGLAAKNAILMVEFATDMQAEGRTALDAILEAARLRIRPIVMTSLAFILGVLPLAVASGAGSGAQNAIGITVLGGMLSATLLGVFFVPVFFVLVRRPWWRRRADPALAPPAAQP